MVLYKLSVASVTLIYYNERHTIYHCYSTLCASKSTMARVKTLTLANENAFNISLEERLFIIELHNQANYLKIHVKIAESSCTIMILIIISVVSVSLIWPLLMNWLFTMRWRTICMSRPFCPGIEKLFVSIPNTTLSFSKSLQPPHHVHIWVYSLLEKGITLKGCESLNC